MAKMHELLAVDQNLKGQAEKNRVDLMNTFEKKKHHFTQTKKTFTPIGENATTVTEEELDLQTTVAKELSWISEFLIKAIDVSHQVNVGNTKANADVVLDNGSAILKALPATTLLELEKRLAEIHTFVAAIPTLDPAKGFRLDTDAGIGVFKARDVVKTRTQKVKEVITLAPPTDKHAAQAQLIDVDRPTGEIMQQEWSGLLTVTDKGLMLERVEETQRAVKRARARANEIEITTDDNRIGRQLVGYIFGLK